MAADARVTQIFLTDKHTLFAICDTDVPLHPNPDLQQYIQQTPKWKWKLMHVGKVQRWSPNYILIHLYKQPELGLILEIQSGRVKARIDSPLTHCLSV